MRLAYMNFVNNVKVLNNKLHMRKLIKKEFFDNAIYLKPTVYLKGMYITCHKNWRSECFRYKYISFLLNVLKYNMTIKWAELTTLFFNTLQQS